MNKSLIILAATLSFGSAAAIAQTPPPEAPMPPAEAPAPPPADPGMTAPPPADATAAPTAMSAAPATPAPDTSAYPACSRSVTDKCVQKAGGGGRKWKKK